MPAMFENVLKTRFTPTEQDDVQKKLAMIDDVSVNGQAVLNLYAERQVEEEEWHVVIRDILAAPRDRGEICEAITASMRRFQLCGPKAKVAAGTIFGRAITSDSMARAIATLGYTLNAARLMVRGYKGLSISVLRSRWRRVPLGSHVMWSTFAEPPHVGTFDGIPRRARDVAAIFGLPLTVKRKRLLLLEYILPRRCTPCVPRVTEAYSGDTWVYYFRPASQEDCDNGCGRTFVWDTHAALFRGRAEVVHWPIVGQHLASEPEEVS